MSEPSTTDYCLQCGESPDSASHVVGGGAHAYVDPHVRSPFQCRCYAEPDLDPRAQAPIEAPRSPFEGALPWRDDDLLDERTPNRSANTSARIDELTLLFEELVGVPCDPKLPAVDPVVERRHWKRGSLAWRRRGA